MNEKLLVEIEGLPARIRALPPDSLRLILLNLLLQATKDVASMEPEAAVHGASVIGHILGNVRGAEIMPVGTPIASGRN